MCLVCVIGMSSVGILIGTGEKIELQIVEVAVLVLILTGTGDINGEDLAPVPIRVGMPYSHNIAS